MSYGTLVTSLMNIQLNDYATVIMLSAVGYDYVLTFSSEIEHIWSKPWSIVSVLFGIVRYGGIYTIIVNSLLGSTFLPGPLKTYAFVLLPSMLISKTCPIYVKQIPLQGTIVNSITLWTYPIFFCAADFVMSLRIWAMYDRSKRILVILLTTFCAEVVCYLFVAFKNTLHNNTKVEVEQILNLSLCVQYQLSPLPWQIYYIPQVVHDGTTCILAIIRFVHQSLQAYKATKTWDLNPYVNLLIGEGVVYFLVVFVSDLFSVLINMGIIVVAKEGFGQVVIVVTGVMPIFILTPRFIMSIRELHSHQIKSREGIDTGFGLTSSTGRSSARTAIVFEAADQNDREDVEMSIIGSTETHAM